MQGGVLTEAIRRKRDRLPSDQQNWQPEDEARAAYAVTMRAHQTKYHVSEEDMDTLVELVGQPIECVTLLLSLIISEGLCKR